jgi:polyketide cyclase/dehydrase/lipid transport protein
MSRIHLSAERVIDAPADIAYHCIADYEAHHKPGGFLPSMFKDQTIERGGVGEGTVIRFKTVVAGKEREEVSEISEPQPGRVLVETGRFARTTFTVEPRGTERCAVRFDTEFLSGGLEGFVTRLLGPRLLRPVYEDELSRLERYAQAHNQQPESASATANRAASPST